MQRKDSVDMAPDVETPTHEDFPESWKKGSRLGRQDTLKTTEETWKPNPELIVTKPVAAPRSPQSEPATQQGRGTSVPRHGAHTQEHEALLIAAEEGHGDAVERLIKKGVDVNAIAGQYGHALAAAAYHGRKEVVKVLLNNGADVNLPGGKCGFALHAAAQEGHLDIVKVLLVRGANVHLQGGQFRFALTAGERNSRVRVESEPLTFTAAYNGNVRTMKVLLDQDASLNAADMENETALHGAVYGGHIEAVEFLLKQGIDPEIRGVENGTALDMAKSLGQQSIVNLLCGWTNRETNPQPGNAKETAEKPLRLDPADSQPVANPVAEALIDEYLTMMLIISAQDGNLEDVQTLLEAGVSPQGTWGNYGYALHAACLNGHLAVAQLLLEHDAQVDAFGGQTGYPLIAACISGNFALVLLLIAWGADIHSGTTTIGGPLHAASRGGHLDIMELLLLLGAPIDWRCGQFGTPLLAAASCGVEPCQFLVSRGANVLARTPDGLNCADVARASGRADAKFYFKQLGVKSSSWFSMAGLASRLSSLSLKVEAANLENESENFLRQPGSGQIPVR
jgi:ankyrin repeat protein